MNDIYVSPRPGLPEIDFRFSQHRLALRGNSYPASATAFYGPLGSALMNYLGRASGNSIRLEVAPALFNASSKRMLRGMFGMLDSACIRGNRVVVEWHYPPDELAMRDLGIDLADEFIMLECRLIEKASPPVPGG